MRCPQCLNPQSKEVKAVCSACIDDNLPSREENVYWITTLSDSTDADFFPLKVTEIDGAMIKARTQQGRFHEFPRTVAGLEQVALETRIKRGKWLIEEPPAQIDESWSQVARVTENGDLGPRCKVSTTGARNRNDSPTHVMCVYTDNAFDEEDVLQVREQLHGMGFTDELNYKADIVTALGVYGHGPLFDEFLYQA